MFVRLGGMVAAASMERGRFAVLELYESKELLTNGGIVVTASGAYACGLRRASGGRS